MTFSTHSILPTHANKVDFNGDGFTDLLWQRTDGTIVAWHMAADGLSFASETYGPPPGNGMVLVGLGVTSTPHVPDLFWQNAAGAVDVGTIANGQVSVSQLSAGVGGRVEAVGDFNRDGHADLLAHYSDGTWSTVSADARKIPPFGLGIIAPFGDDYHVTGVGDFDGDGRTDILFRATGAHAGTMVLQVPVSVYDRFDTLETAPLKLADPGPAWNVLGIGDFNGDGSADLLWQHDSGLRTMWFGGGGTFVDGGALPDPGPDWSVVGTGDYNNDGAADLMWQCASQPTLHVEWLMHGAQPIALGAVFNVGTDWALA